MQSDSENGRCEQCGREAGSIFSCPERALGYCPFVVTQKQRDKNILVFGAVLTIILAGWGYVVGQLLADVALSSILAGFGYVVWQWILLVGVALSSGLWAFTKHIQLHNSSTQTSWQATTTARVIWDCKWVSKREKVQIHLESSDPITFPLSIVALSEYPDLAITKAEAEAVSLARAATINLLLKEQVEIHSFQSQKFGLTRRPQPVIVDYIVVNTNKRPGAGLGLLELGMVAAIDHWVRQPEPKVWSEGPTIYEMVFTLYEDDKNSPEQWLAEVVAGDAVRRGLGQRTGRFPWRRKIVWNSQYSEQLQRALLVMQELSEQLVRNYPDFSLRLDQQILAAIKAREVDHSD